MTDLMRGDVLSYSAGTSHERPDGFRVVQRAGEAPRPGILSAIVERWPDMLAVLGGATPPLFVNAYPANVGRFDAGVVVDTYLSERTLSRALLLAVRESLPVVLMAQPLFAAHALRYHIDAGRPLPGAMLLGVGGYPMPASLQSALEGWLADPVPRLQILHFFGLAEIDAAMLLGRHRDVDGAVVYHPRPDVRVKAIEGELHIALRAGDGTWPVETPTGDVIRASDDGFVFPRAAGRADGAVFDAFNRWSPAHWSRRTGYVARDGAQIIAQLRDGIEPEGPDELGFWAFGARFGFTWLRKPVWR